MSSALIATLPGLRAAHFLRLRALRAYESYARATRCSSLSGLLPRIRVIYLTHYYLPEAGAPQARISALAAGLSEAGVAVTIHTCPPHYPDGAIKRPYRNRPLTIGRDGSVRIVRSAVLPAANRGFAKRLANHASFAATAVATAPLTGPADVVVVESPPLFLARAAVAYAKLKRARLIVHVSDLWPDSAIDLGTLTSPTAIRLARAIERSCYKNASAIVCPTRGIRDRLDTRPEAAGKARRIEPTVDAERFRATPPPSNGPFRVLYAGTIGLAQGVGTLVEAARRLPQTAPATEVIVAGDGAESQKLRDEIGCDGAPNVQMVGVVTPREVASLYESSHASVVLLRDRPVFRGALPTKMLEAMAAGRPIILSAAGEAAEFVHDAGSGVVVPPEDPDSLAAAISELAVDRDRAAALGAAGRRCVERHHGRRVAVERWLELFEEVLAR